MRVFFFFFFPVAAFGFVAVPSSKLSSRYSGHARERKVVFSTSSNEQQQQPNLGEVVVQSTGTVYPRSQYNLPILGSLLAGALVALLFRDALAIAALYQFDSIMEADWAPESLKLLARLPSDWLQDYGSAASANPLVVKACTSAVAYLVGDIVAQAFEGRREVALLDLARVFRNCAAGFLLHGPILHLWIEYLEGPFTLSFSHYFGLPDILGPGTSAEYSLIAAKIALDQTAFAISFNTIYSVGLGLMALKTFSQIQRNVRDTLVSSVVTSWKFWPIVHIVSYSPLIPVQYKLLWIDVMEIAWVALLSTIANDEKLMSAGSAGPEQQQHKTLNNAKEEDTSLQVQPALEIALSRQRLDKQGEAQNGDRGGGQDV